MLAVSVIVLVAAAYSTWALLPAPAKQKLAGGLLPIADGGWCPGWLRRRIRDAAANSAATSDPCSSCGAKQQSRDEIPR
jgi:hypothetical protein